MYQNVSAPALAAAAGLEKALDGFEREKAEAYCPDHLESVTGGPAMVRLPDQSPADAWSEAAAAFQRAAMEECRTACGADRIRQFRWKAQFSEQAWTLLLLPVYASYYEDDSGQPQQVFIHGRTGEISGARRASLRRAKQTSLSILLAGVALLVTGLILFLLARQSLAELAFLLLLGGMLGVAGSLAPLGIAWEFNRQQKREGEGYRKAF